MHSSLTNKPIIALFFNSKSSFHGNSREQLNYMIASSHMTVQYGGLKQTLNSLWAGA